MNRTDQLSLIALLRSALSTVSPGGAPIFAQNGARGLNRIHLYSRRILLTTASLGIALILFGCGGGSSSTNLQSQAAIPGTGDGTSGVQGRVVSVPTGTTSTTSPPVSGAVITILSSDNATAVATATTGSDGSYHIPLRPGSYFVSPQPVSATLVPLTGAQPVNVMRGFVDINISYITNNGK